ncbi:Dit2 protein [Scheffersomyces amazonensis]|uniref:Dit2 protein n=1 Tax=Scheffersomyces amazonensis TaxID=1078765 RepID=UPI00315DC15E
MYSVETWVLVKNIASIAIGFSVYKILCIIFPPFNFPKNIPTIPFYVSFLGLITSFDQEDIYKIYLKEKMEKHGAVKIYFASRWNILVSKPEYLLEIFKSEDIYAKSGNQEKIPYSVLSEYTGENIISAHGESWKLYRSILKQSIQFPKLEPVNQNTKKLITLLKTEISKNGNILHVTDILQKYSLENIGKSVLGINFKCLEDDESIIHNKIKFLKSKIFNPLYLNFPFLDKLQIPSRQKARKEVIKFRHYFINQIFTSREPSGTLGTAGNKLVEAYDNQDITMKQLIDNSIILMVAGHENPLLLMLSLLFVIAKYPSVQIKIRNELNSKDLETPYLYSVIYETLRIYPPLGQIINRKTTRNIILGGLIKVPKGVYVGYNNLVTGRDKTVWEFSDEFLPERWGKTSNEIHSNFTTAKRNATLPAFHGRKRACLGEKFAIFEVRALIIEIMSNFEISLVENWKEKITAAGPICPLKLQIKFQEIN